MRETIEPASSPEALPKSIQLAKLLEGADPEEVRQKLGELLSAIEKDTGRTFSSDVATIYKNMYEEQCLARIEQLSRVLETVELNKPLAISDEHETHYANAVVPTAQGLKVAFSEGQAPGPVRTVVGFGKTLIGFKTEHITVEEVAFSESDIRNAEERRFLCRHVVGSLEKEDIRHLVMRIPAQLVSEGLLTDDEKKKKSSFIFRGMQL